MAQIDCTMDKLKFPNVVNFQRSYGTRKMANGGSLTTEEFNQNLFLPFDNDRPIIISENSATSVIEYPAKFLMNTPNVTLTLGNGDYSGLEITVLVTVQGANRVTISRGQTSDVLVGGNRIYKYMWTGSSWICSSIPNMGPVLSARAVGTCESEENAAVKDIYLTDYTDIILPAEMSIHFTNKNSFGDTTASTPTYPTARVYNSNNVLLSTQDICDSRGHYAGEGCWGDGDDIDFTNISTKSRITNSDVRQQTSNMTIKSDGSFIYPYVRKMQKSITADNLTDFTTYLCYEIVNLNVSGTFIFYGDWVNNAYYTFTVGRTGDFIQGVLSMNGHVYNIDYYIAHYRNVYRLTREQVI